ncbi:hypothetical protein [Planctobacterium marinum]|uniref:Lipoprotein n=1 Tax=Planctobacterium marinum TaxID=1631968 RepID=A0AA48KSM3_9ALTE|nr:hypothetical protein MACH26_28130 [Planctobacterium marinum]
MLKKIFSTLIITSLLTGCGNDFHPEKVDLSEIFQHARATTKLQDAALRGNKVTIHYTRLHEELSTIEGQRAYNKKMKAFIPDHPKAIVTALSSIENEINKLETPVKSDDDITELLEDSQYMNSLRDASEVHEDIYDFLIECAESGLFKLEKMGDTYMSITMDYASPQVRDAEKKMARLHTQVLNHFADIWADEYVIGTQSVDIGTSKIFEADYDSAIWFVEMEMYGEDRRGNPKTDFIGAIISTKLKGEAHQEQLMEAETFVPGKSSGTLRAIDAFRLEDGTSLLSRMYTF